MTAIKRACAPRFGRHHLTEVPLPQIADRQTWQAQIDGLRGRSQLIVYFHKWHTGRPAAEQCEGCAFSTTHIHELSYLNSRDVSYATFCEGPYDESSRYRDFRGWTVPWYSVPKESVDQLVAGRHFGILASYLRDGDRAFETY